MDEPNKPQVKKYKHEYDPNVASDMLALDLERKLSETIWQRGTLDARMVEDLRQYHGVYDPDVENALKKTKQRSRVFVNHTRPKSDAAEAQMVDLLFPNDDRNWGIKPTPVPDIVKELDDDSPAVVGGQQYQDEEGNVIKNSDIASRKLELAKDACGKMAKQIDDQLIETNYNMKARQAIHDGVTIGTGIIKGPVVTGKLNKRYKKLKTPTGESGFQMMLEHLFDAGVESVRPWDFYPDMSASSVSEAEFIFERRFMTKKQVRELVRRKGYNPDDIRKVLKMASTETQHPSGAVDDIRRLAGLNDQLNDSRYEVWEYHGPIPRDVLIEKGMIGEDEEEDPLKERNGTVVYCGGVVLNVKLNLIDFDDTFPYQVWNWSPDESCIFGYGVPRLMRDEQRIVNTSWRAMLDNAAVTAGPQIGLRRKHVEPVDGNWELTPFKMWSVREGGSMAESMQSMEFNSHQNELANIYQMGRQMIDEVTGIPMIQQGEQGQATQVLGGMSMLMNAANTVRRNQVKMWDDRITSPLITSMYHFNMAFSDDEEIKGDYKVEARGTSALLVRETLSNAIMNLMNITGANPMYQQIVAPKAREILVQWAKTQQLPESLIPTEEELQQYQQQQSEQQGQQQDPAQVNAQIQMQIEQYRGQLQQQKLQVENQRFEREQQFDAQVKQAELESRLREKQMELQKIGMQQQTELMKLASNEKISGQKLATELKKVQAKLDAEMQKFATEIDLKIAMPPTGNYGLE